jgi:hypothetical protein
MGKSLNASGTLPPGRMAGAIFVNDSSENIAIRSLHRCREERYATEPPPFFLEKAFNKIQTKNHNLFFWGENVLFQTNSGMKDPKKNHTFLTTTVKMRSKCNLLLMVTDTNGNTSGSNYHFFFHFTPIPSSLEHSSFHILASNKHLTCLVSLG